MITAYTSVSILKIGSITPHSANRLVRGACVRVESWTDPRRQKGTSTKTSNSEDKLRSLMNSENPWANVDPMMPRSLPAIEAWREPTALDLIRTTLRVRLR